MACLATDLLLLPLCCCSSSKSKQISCSGLVILLLLIFSCRPAEVVSASSSSSSLSKISYISNVVVDHDPLLLLLSTAVSSLTRKQGKRIMWEERASQKEDKKHQQRRQQQSTAAILSPTTTAVSSSTITSEATAAAAAATVVATAASVSLRGGGAAETTCASPVSASCIIRKSSTHQHHLKSSNNSVVLFPTPSLRQRDSVYLWSSLAAGAGSGALASIICAPLDLIRTRLQVWGQVTRATAGSAAGANVNKLAAHHAITQMLKDIIKTDGIRGCFRGLGATLVTVPTFWGVYFPLYDDFKRHAQNKYPNTHSSLIHMTCAVMAGAVSDVICNPMFVVRTRLQTEALHNVMEKSAGNIAATATATVTRISSQQTKNTGIIDTIKLLYIEGGWRIFWRGMSANLIGLSHAAVQFPTYEILKNFFKHDKQHESAFDLLLASGLSKMTASLLTYPHEVVRSRMMDARVPELLLSGGTTSNGKVGLINTCQYIYATEGMIGFYAGLPISLIRVIPNTCITFLTYEMILRLAKNKIEESRSQNGQ